MLMLDLQKAFDTVQHNILLEKLSALGMSDNTVKWFRNYLTDRRQLVDINGTYSDFCKVSCGVPQGSILGPLLFTIYVNDMVSAVQCKLLLYGDDSVLIVSGKNFITIQEQLSCQLSNVSNWLVDNKLSLHLGKTESIIFGSKRSLKKCNTLDIQCNGVKIESKTFVKYLGSVLDQTFSGETVVNNIVKKVNSRLKFLYRKQGFLDINVRKLLSNAIIQPHFDYACSYGIVV